jgi:hypothetical protein
MSDEKRAPALPWTCAEIPKILTYIHPGPEPWEPRYQLQWDYQIEWPSGERPRIKLLRYRSFQENPESKKAELVEDISEDIPVNELVIMNIAKHAAGYIYANSDLDGNWRFADRTLFDGSAEAAKKRFSLASFRQMVQVDPNPRIS